MKPHRRTAGEIGGLLRGQNGCAQKEWARVLRGRVRRRADWPPDGAGAREKTFANICKKGLHIPAGCDTMTKSRAFAQALGRSRLRKSGIEKFGGN